MTIDEKDFFREATLRICGSLEIEKAMWICLLYIRQFIPVAQMNLHLYDRSLGIAETITHVTVESGKRVSVKTAFSTQSRKKLEELRFVRIKSYDKPGDRNVLEEFVAGLKHLGFLPQLSYIFLDLVIERSFIGVLSAAYEQGETVLPHHLNLLGQLNEPFSIALSNNLRYRELREYLELLADDSRYFQEELRKRSGEEVIGANSGLRRVMELVRQVAYLDSPVLLMGEAGVGKEIIAGAVHNLSMRREGPFIKVNCGALPQSLMDAELFGHEKGAFTGAIAQKRGLFERAQGGTLFLDEIGELSPEAQVKLLRVLQEKEIERLGGTDTIHVDIRIIAATHRNLELLLERGQFREDLYYRLKVFPIVIPPLRDRKVDIPMLVQHFIQKKAREMKRIISPSLVPGAIDQLMEYHWPGNVRQLENTVERAMILCNDNLLRFEPMIQPTDRNIKIYQIPDTAETFSLDLTVGNQIKKALAKARGKVHGKGGAAELLGINPGTLRHKMRKLGIPFGRKFKERRSNLSV